MPGPPTLPIEPSSRTRVYADTSVYGGVFDDRFAWHSAEFFTQVRTGRLRLVTSALVRLELEPAPQSVRDFFAELGDLEDAPISETALDLQQRYLSASVVGEGSATDALHVAVATTAHCSILVSWNYKHIVHRDKAPRYNAVNILAGAPAIGIFSPAEVLEYGQEL